jgi:hypothetical protein
MLLDNATAESLTRNISALITRGGTYGLALRPRCAAQCVNGLLNVWECMCQCDAGFSGTQCDGRIPDPCVVWFNRYENRCASSVSIRWAGTIRSAGDCCEEARHVFNKSCFMFVGFTFS